MARSADNRRDVQNAQSREKVVRNQELADIRGLMQTPPGRRLAQRMLDFTGAEKLTVFQPNAMALANDVGVQRVGYWLLAEIRASCPELELVMRQETLRDAKRIAMQEEADDGRDTDD